MKRQTIKRGETISFHRIKVRVQPALKAIVRREARKHKMSMSAWMCQAIKYQLARMTYREITRMVKEA